MRLRNIQQLRRGVAVLSFENLLARRDYLDLDSLNLLSSVTSATIKPNMPNRIVRIGVKILIRHSQVLRRSSRIRFDTPCLPFSDSQRITASSPFSLSSRHQAGFSW